MSKGRLDEPVAALPTATHVQLVRHATPVRTVAVAPEGFGEAASDHDWPFQVRTWETWTELETVKPTAVQDVALKQLTSKEILGEVELGCGTPEVSDQLDPFHVSTRFCAGADVGDADPTAVQNEAPAQETENISPLE
jgi:hypothetical protein